MSFQINKPLDHIERSLGMQKEKGSENEYPSLVLDTIQTIVEAKGWQAVYDRGNVSLTSAANLQALSGPPVPEGEMHFCTVAHAFHSDLGANHVLRLDIEDAAIGLTIGISTALPVSDFQAIAIPRPVLLVEGQNLRVSSVDLVGIGNTLGLQYFFIRLAPGEYIPGGPYG